MKETVITYQNRVYKISPGAVIAAEIEEEIAPIPDLAARFANGKWCVRELMILIHMMLESAGRSTDFMALGEQMVADGLGPYRAAAAKFLNDFF